MKRPSGVNAQGPNPRQYIISSTNHHTRLFKQKNCFEVIQIHDDTGAISTADSTATATGSSSLSTSSAAVGIDVDAVTCSM